MIKKMQTSHFGVSAFFMIEFRRRWVRVSNVHKFSGATASFLERAQILLSVHKFNRACTKFLERAKSHIIPYLYEFRKMLVFIIKLSYLGFF